MLFRVLPLVMGDAYSSTSGVIPSASGENHDLCLHFV
jgi:hypothetical protein